mmetsp:Transcript_22660/g.39806  ORF Transcript_22660/g.39806 Transcript_22660/m.39806 type:complete len:148 (-) Transcript_22660:56-499(-)
MSVTLLEISIPSISCSKSAQFSRHDRARPSIVSSYILIPSGVMAWRTLQRYKNLISEEQLGQQPGREKGEHSGSSNSPHVSAKSGMPRKSIEIGKPLTRVGGSKHRLMQLPFLMSATHEMNRFSCIWQAGLTDMIQVVSFRFPLLDK